MILICFGRVSSQIKVVMMPMQLVNIDVQYEEGFRKTFADEVNRCGAYNIVFSGEKNSYFNSIPEGCKYALSQEAYYYLTSFMNISNNKVQMSFYMYDASTSKLAWKEEVTKVPVKELEINLKRVAAYLGRNDKKVSAENQNPILGPLENYFIKPRFLTYGVRCDYGQWMIKGKDPVNVTLAGISMQYDIKKWFFEPGVLVGFGHVRPMIYYFSVNRMILDRKSAPYLGIGIGKTKTSVRFNEMTPPPLPGSPARLTEVGQFYFMEAGYFFSRRKVYNFRIAIKPGITSFGINGAKAGSISLSATFSIAP